jgi:hypothetical protein
MTSEENRPERKSHFLVTINSNKVPKTPAEHRAIVECFDRFMYDFFNHSNRSYAWYRERKYDIRHNLERIFLFIDGDGDIESINKINVKYAVEKGKKTRGGRIHLHAHLTVYHTARLRMDIEELKTVAVEYLRRCGLGINSVYINVKAFSDRARNLEIYLEKENGRTTRRTIYSRHNN